MTCSAKRSRANQKARLRTLKDLDESAVALAEACHLLLDPELPDEYLRKKVINAKHLGAPLAILLWLTPVFRPFATQTPYPTQIAKTNSHYQNYPCPL
jgi:hypothetical protein